MNLFKVGVSDWHFECNNFSFDLKAVTKESITVWSDGSFEIILEDAVFDIDNWNKLLKIRVIDLITQSFVLRNNRGEAQPKTELSYDNALLISIGQKSENQNVASVTITITNQ